MKFKSRNFARTVHQKCKVGDSKNHKKSIKNQQKSSTNASEITSQINARSWIDFRANLAPFWEGFGAQHGAKLAPNCSKNRCPNRSKKLSHFGPLLGPILIDFGRFLVPKWSPRGGQRNHFSRFFWLLEPFWGQDASKSSHQPIHPSANQPIIPRHGGG